MNSDKKLIANGLFVKQNWTAKDIAKHVGVTAKTVGNWIRDGNWKDQKEAQTITRSNLLIDSYKQLAAINKRVETDHDGVPNKELSDAKAIIRKEIEALSHNPLYIYVEVMEELVEWISKNQPASLKEFSKIMNSFIENVSKRR